MAPAVKTISRGSRAEERGDPAARLLERRRGDVADGVQRGGVAERLREVRQHRLDHARVDRLGAW